MAGTQSDVAVVGAGIVGLAVTHALQERGVDVVCLDAGEPGMGQSAGQGRVFRHHIGTPELTALAVEAHAGWEAWSDRAGEPLLRTGGWVRLGGDREADIALLRGAGVPVTELDPDEAAAVMPIIARPPTPLLLDPLGGSTRTAATIGALLRWLAPATVRRTRVHAVAADPGGARATLRTDDGPHTCGVCLVCAGPGTDALARGAGLPVTQARRVHLRLTFRSRTGVDEPMPSWSDRSGAHGEQAYGVATDGSTYGLGIAALDAYPAAAPDAEAVTPGTDVDEARRRIVAYAHAAFPGLDPDPVDEVLRLTTSLPGRDDEAFAFWREGPIAAFAGGNLYKFAPLLGTRLAAAVLGEGVEVFPGERVATSGT